MPTLIERARAGLASALLGDEKRRLEETTRLLYNAYIEGPYIQAPEMLLTQLAEQDSAILQDLLLQLGWESYGLGYGADTTAERQRAVNESRRLWRHSVIAQWEIGLWTSFGFGESIVITPLSKEPASRELDQEGNPIPLAQVAFQEFWTADRNQPLLAADKIHDKLSNWLLIDGERFLAFYASDLDGEARIRRIPADEIVEIVTDPDDDITPLFYKRQFNDRNGAQQEWYYPDWQLFFSDELDDTAERVLPSGAKRADKMNSDDGQLGGERKPGTVVCVLDISLASRDDTDLRGWPLLAPAGAPWIRIHKKFREDRAAVASTAAMFVQKIKHKGGSRAGNALRAAMQTALSASQSTETNPPPVAGSTWVGNDAVDLEKVHNIGTAAGDAKTDGEAMALMAGLAGGCFPHYMGFGDAYRLATATAMERPLLLQWSRYQLFWSAQFRKIVRIVLQFHERYNNGVKFDTYEAEVSTDRLVEADLEVLTEAAGRFYRDVLVPQIELGTVDADVVRALTARISRVILQALGVTDADEVASDERFGVGAAPPEGEEAPEEWAAELASAMRDRYEAGKSPAEAVADWALATLIEAR